MTLFFCCCGKNLKRNCEYPQELTLQLEALCELKQIQVLSHQSNIATKIELYLSEDGRQYARLGFLSLKSNKESNYTARELKTVHIDNRALFVKMKLHQCYINEKNLYSQVGIVAINLMGESIQEENELPNDNHSLELNMGRIPSIPKAKHNVKVNDTNDMDMRFDAKTANKIREIYVAKEKAVAMEDYDQVAYFSNSN